LGCPLQRLFSTFPNSWPGAGLLLLRVCLGFAPLYFGICDLSGKPSVSAALPQNLIAALTGIFLLAGLWTPVMATVVALDEVWTALWLFSPPREETWVHIFLVILGASVAMLGPGACSVDAHLFGRRRFDFDRNRDRKRRR
jgi:uncharacterized membrane protein YphA (DoxX/SURF4 family)